MSSPSPPTIAETIQTEPINRGPSPAHDIMPSTPVGTEFPIQSRQHHRQSRRKAPPSSLSHATSEGEEEGERGEGDGEEVEDDDEIPYSVIRPIRRKPVFPPLPDLRFEQSYLASIRGAQGWKGVLGVTVRDQGGFYPTALTFAVCGGLGSPPAHTRDAVDTRVGWVEALE